MKKSLYIRKSIIKLLGHEFNKKNCNSNRAKIVINIFVSEVIFISFRDCESKLK